MRRILLVIVAALSIAVGMSAQQVARVTYKSFKHYNERVEEFRHLPPVKSTDIVMFGNSLTEFGGDWNNLLNTTGVVNRGIVGDDAKGMLNRLCQVLPGKPRIMFFECGMNDFSHGITPEQVAQGVQKTIMAIRRQSPETKLYVQCNLPMSEYAGIWKTLAGKTNDVPKINRLMKAWCEKNGITYIDMFDAFVIPGTNEMRRELTVDGLHLSPLGYKIWCSYISKYIQ